MTLSFSSRFSRLVLFAAVATSTLLRPAGAASAESFTSSGVLYFNNEPRFNIGYYDADGTPQQHGQSIDRLADAGFNTMLFVQNVNGTGDGALRPLHEATYDRADRRGVGLIPLADVNDDPYQTDGAIHRRWYGWIKDKPALLLANVRDDVYLKTNQKHANLPVPDRYVFPVIDADFEAKRIQGGVGTMISGNTSNYFFARPDRPINENREPTPFLPHVDIFEQQAYAISYREPGVPSHRGPIGVWEIVRNATDAASNVLDGGGEQKPIVAALQTFNYQDVVPAGQPERGTRLPTAAETKVSSWLALIAGAKGVHYYKMRDDAPAPRWIGDPTRAGTDTRRRIWDESSRFARDVLESELPEVLLFGDRSAKNKGGGLFYASWYHKESVYLIAVNVSKQEKTLSDPLPRFATGTPSTVLNTNFPRKASVSGGGFSVRMPGESVVINRFRHTNPRSEVRNGGFQSGRSGNLDKPNDWTVSPAAANQYIYRVADTPGMISTHHLRTRTPSGETGYVYQTVRGLADGAYTLRARSRSGVTTRSLLIAKKFDRQADGAFTGFRSVRAAASGNDAGIEISIRNIDVRGGELEVGFLADDRGSTSRIDDVRLIKID